MTAEFKHAFCPDLNLYCFRNLILRYFIHEFMLSIHVAFPLVKTRVTSYTEVCGFPALIEGYPGLWPITLDCQSLANFPQ